MDWSGLWESVASIGAAVLVSIIGYVAKEIASKLKSQVAVNLLILIREAAKAGVNVAQQKYVDSIKKASKDGKLTSGEQEEAIKIAMRAARNAMGKEAISRASRVFGLENQIDFNAFLGSHIESAVTEKKRQEKN